MKERVRKRLMIAGMVSVLCFSVCACGDGGNTSIGEQEGVSNYNSNEEMNKVPSKAEQKEIKKELDKMKEEGILDENGQPMPGVDLRDYPGLG